ncbi:MAG TPA: GNAT family N-acetyltransferase [Gemmatimonadales bacterium]
MSEVKTVTVIPYRSEYREAFERLNRAWIEKYFTLEPADREIFSDPESKVLAPGGQIFFVLEGARVLGTCAVLRDGDECEIAKMAVAPEARGRGYGDRLMEAAIGFAGEIGASRIVIVSNTVLEPAIRLYLKHGFVRVPLSADGRYRRANIRLERDLGSTAPGGGTLAADESPAAGPRHR